MANENNIFVPEKIQLFIHNFGWKLTGRFFAFVAATRAGVVAEVVELVDVLLPVDVDVLLSVVLVDCDVEVVPPVDVLVVVVLTTVVSPSSEPSSYDTSVTSVTVVISPPALSTCCYYTSSSSSALTVPSATNPAIKSSVDALFILFEFNIIIS